MEQNAQTRLANGVHWLRGCMHCVCCDRTCGVRQCSVIRDLLLHMHMTPPSSCEQHCTGHCMPVRGLLVHYLGCMSPGCPLCAPVYHELIEGVPLQQDQAAQAACTPTKHMEPASPPPKPQVQQPTVDAHEAFTSTNDSLSTEGQEWADDSSRIDDSSSGWGSDFEDDYLEDEDMVSGSCSVSIMHEHTTTCTACQASPTSKAQPQHLAVALPQANDQLISFAQFLIHSLLRWPAADADSAPEASMDQEVVVSWDSDPHTLMWAGRQLWAHLLHDCDRTSDDCTHPGCKQARRVMLHILTCQDPCCSLCVPVRGHFAADGPDAIPVLQQAQQHSKQAGMDDWLMGINAALDGLRL